MLALGLLDGGGGPGAGAAQARRAPGCPGPRWVAAWEAPPSTGVAHDFGGQTLREVVSPHFAGPAIRVRLSNRFGRGPLVVGDATVARRGAGAALVPDTTRALTFRGARRVSIPAGATVHSDPVRFRIAPFSDLAVSLYLGAPASPATEHTTALQTSFAASGDHVSDGSARAFAHTMTAWDFLTGVEVLTARPARTMVAFGDSITDGAGSTPDRNLRWPDLLTRRLQSGGAAGTLAVVNAGITGNRLLADTDRYGPSGLRRLPGDVLSQPGLGAVIMLLGINDIGNPEGEAGRPAGAGAIIGAYRTVIRRVHAAGAKLFIGTLTPAGDPTAPTAHGPGYSSPAGVAERAAVNRWIRRGRGFDGVIDFDRAIRDPRTPNHIRATFNSGDNLHPNDAGYRALADAVPLGRLVRAGGDRGTGSPRCG